MRIRKKIFGTPKRPRVGIFRSNRYTYAFLVDDEAGKVLAGVKTKVSKAATKKEGNRKIDESKAIGKQLGEMASKLKVKEVVFDRSGYRFGGRVKALAEGLKESGIKV